MRAPCLLELPNELLVHVASYVEFDDPKALGALTRTCWRLHQCCTPSVAARKDLDNRYWVIHDRNPLTVLRLLHAFSQTSGPWREAWHMRRAEFWFHRRTFDQWCDLSDFHRTERTYTQALTRLLNEDDSLDLSGFDLGETSEEADRNLDVEIKGIHALRTEGRGIIHRDRRMYQRLLREVFHLGEESILQLILDDAIMGEEEVQKALLLPLCPRLDTIVFIAYMQWTTLNSNHPLYLLDLFIGQCYLGKTKRWLPGFQSLRKVSINSESSIRKLPSQAAVNLFCPKLRDVEPLFALPNLKILHLGGIGRLDIPDVGSDVWPPLQDLDLRAGTSSVEALELCSCNLDMVDTHRLLSLPKRLRYFQSDDPHTPEYLRTLHGAPKSLSDSLERFTFRSIYGGNLWCFANYTSLRHVEGLTPDALFWRKKRPTDEESYGPSETFDFFTSRGGLGGELVNAPGTLEALELTLPPSMETLSIHFLIVKRRGLGFLNAFLRELLRNVSGNAADEAHTGAPFPYLRKVTFLFQNGTLPEDFEWDEVTLADLKGRGIEVTNRQIHPTDEMPEYEEVDDSQSEHCFEDRHYTDPRLGEEAWGDQKFGIVKTYDDLEAKRREAELSSDDEGSDV